jgi:hypothetical protein
VRLLADSSNEGKTLPDIFKIQGSADSYLKVWSLGCPITRAPTAVLSAGQNDGREPLGLVPHGSIVDEHLVTAGNVHGLGAYLTAQELERTEIKNGNYGENRDKE